MTIAKMHEEFKLSRDGIDSSVYAEIMDAEIDYFLNEAMDRYVKTHYSKNNLYRKGFEENQKRIDDLRILTKSKFVKVALAANYQSTDKNVFKALLEPINTAGVITSPFYDDEAYTTISTDQYLFYIKSSVESCKDSTGTCCGWKGVNLRQQDDLHAISGDPFNKPTAENPVLFFEDGQLHIWTEIGGEIKNVLLTFIKRPIRMDITSTPAVDCELSEHTHKEIVQMAVDITLENLQSPRVQTNEENIQKME